MSTFLKKPAEIVQTAPAVNRNSMKARQCKSCGYFFPILENNRCFDCTEIAFRQRKIGKYIIVFIDWTNFPHFMPNWNRIPAIMAFSDILNQNFPFVPIEAEDKRILGNYLDINTYYQLAQKMIAKEDFDMRFLALRMK